MTFICKNITLKKNKMNFKHSKHIIISYHLNQFQYQEILLNFSHSQNFFQFLHIFLIQWFQWFQKHQFLFIMKQFSWNLTSIKNDIWLWSKNFDANNLNYVIIMRKILMIFSIVSINLFSINWNFHISLNKWNFFWMIFSWIICQKITFKSDFKIFFEC